MGNSSGKLLKTKYSTPKKIRFGGGANLWKPTQWIGRNSKNEESQADQICIEPGYINTFLFIKTGFLKIFCTKKVIIEIELVLTLQISFDFYIRLKLKKSFFRPTSDKILPCT